MFNMAQCVRCGYLKRSKDDPYICEDCREAKPVVDGVWEAVDEKFSQPKIVNPDEDILRLCADLSFLTTDSPDWRIFYKIATLLIKTSWAGRSEITEKELNKKIRTTRSLHDVFQVLEDLDLVEVDTGKFQRILKLREKVDNFSSIWDTENLNEQIEKRSSEQFTGYFLFYVIHKLNNISRLEEIDELPFQQRPRRLWVASTLFLTGPYNGEESISEKEIDRHLGRRGVTSSLGIKQSLHQMNKNQTGLVKDVKIENGMREFQYSDYLVRELTRIRKERGRERT